MNETTLSVINLLPSGKEQIKSFVQTIKSEILADETDPLKILVQLKYAEKTISEILKDKEIDQHFLNEHSKYDKRENVVIGGAKLTQSEVGVKYFYEECGDPTWDHLNEKIKNLNGKKKAREEFLKNIPLEGSADLETGAVIHRSARSSKTKVIVRL